MLHTSSQNKENVLFVCVKKPRRQWRGREGSLDHDVRQQVEWIPGVGADGNRLVPGMELALTIPRAIDALDFTIVK